MTDKQIIIDDQMENLNNLATQQLKRIEEEKRQIEHIAKTHLVETFEMQREIDKLKKELKAKEQECEELKEKYLELKEQNGSNIVQLNTANEQLDQLKAELTRANYQIADDEILQCDMREAIEELKAENKELKLDLIEAKAHGDYLNNLALSKTLDDVSDELEELKAENEELKKFFNEGCLHNLTLMTEQRVLLQTLTEIKEIAESEMDSKEFMAVQCMLNGSVDNKNKVLEQILQKINECEGDNEQL